MQTNEQLIVETINSLVRSGSRLPSAAVERENIREAIEKFLEVQAAVGVVVPTEMRICELNHLMLHANQPYIFTVDENCENCKKYAAESDPFGHKVKAQ